MNMNETLLRHSLGGLALLCVFLAPVPRAHGAAPDCTVAAGLACYSTFQPPGSKGTMQFLSSLAGDADAVQPTKALIAIHGYPRDANRTFNAALRATSLADRFGDTLVVVPLFQVPAALASRCHTAGVPPARDGDLVWRCASWMDGAAASNDPATTSFSGLHALLAELRQRWPTLNTITIAGFSSGAQMVQHYIGFAADVQGVRRRYVVSDPGTWLYFDPQRVQLWRNGTPADWSACLAVNGTDIGNCKYVLATPASACAGVNKWRYGVEQMPTGLRRNAEQARLRYSQAEVHYLQGALDNNASRGAFYGILDKSCAANAQGPFRLQRGLAYAAYDRALLSKDERRSVTAIAGCAHDVACVFAAAGAQQALFGE